MQELETLKAPHFWKQILVDSTVLINKGNGSEYYLLARMSVLTDTHPLTGS
jgi:hypothetical protein